MDEKQTKISVPRGLLNSLIEAQGKWQKFSNELEDFLMSTDENFLKKMRKARKEHLEGNIRDIDQLKQEL